MSQYRPSIQHRTLGRDFYDPVAPASFPSAILRFRNDRHAARFGLDPLSDAEWIAHFGRFAPLPQNHPEPLALRYHGHQFRHYNPEIGDGRGFLFAQMIDPENGRLMDLGTKGSGRTPWSRAGDGKLTLKGGVREILATEMLEALGVETSKSFSLIETGEALVRGDEPSPTRSSVLVRLSHSHIRIGTFQRLAARDETENLRKLVDYCISHYWPEATRDPDPVAGFYACVTEAVARMGGQWFAAGFVHGVLNTDNITITGESFDYGPWRFLPSFDPGFVAAYFDDFGLYAFGRQGEALHWNLTRLAECLLPLTSFEGLEPIQQHFPRQMQHAMTRSLLKRLGLGCEDPNAIEPLMIRLTEAMQMSEAPFQQVLFDLIGGGLPERLARSPLADLYQTPVWAEILDALRALPVLPGTKAALSLPYATRPEPETLLIDEVEALWTAISQNDDWQPFYDKIAAIRAMGAFHAAFIRP